MSPARLFPLALLLLGTTLRLQAQDCEVPGTVAKGAWLLESDSLVWGRELHTEVRDGFRSSNLGYAGLLLSTGLTERLDIQFGYGGWYYESSGVQDSLERHTNSGEGCLRMKWALVGEDGKGPAFALLPYLSRPVHGGGRTTHGLLLPFSMPLSERFSLNAQAGLERHGDEEGRWVSDFRSNLCLSRSIGTRWAGYLELRASLPCQIPRAAYVELGPGLVFNASERLTFEVEYFAGMQRRAPDWTFVLRVSLSL